MIKKVFISLVMLASLAVATTTTVIGSSSTVSAASCNDKALVLGFPKWYRGLVDSNCHVTINSGQNGIAVTITTIALNLLQAGFVLAVYVCTFFIIRGGFGYIVSAGSTDGMASAKKTITNAIIGLIITALAASIVNAIAGVIR